MIPELLKDIEVRYLFTKRFDWTHPALREKYQAHPIPGRVYRDIFNPTTKNHKIILIGNEGLGLDTLIGSSDLSDYEFKEITLETIMDFDIKEEDLDQLNKWIESENSDIKKLYAPVEKGLSNLKEALHQQREDEDDSMDRAYHVIYDLYQASPDKFHVMLNFIEYLTDKDLYSHLDISNYIRYHPVDGKGVNVTKALQAIERYNSDERRSNQQIEDLYAGMEALVVEIERKLTNGLID